MDTDEALAYSGSWGRFQKRVYALIFLSAFPNAFFMLHFVFSNYEPPHRCQLPDEFVNISLNGLGNSTVLDFMLPEEKGKDGNVHKSQCRMYNRTYADYISMNWTNLPNSSNEIIKCTDGYMFDLVENQKSAVSEFSMVCKDDWKPTLAVAMYQAGYGVGALSSSLADRFGRRPMFLLSCIGHVTFGAFISVTWNSYAYIASGFFCATFAQLNYVTAFVVGAEITDASWRNFMGVAGMYSFAIAYCLIAGLGYFLQNWRWLIGVSSILSALAYLPNFWFFPESPRWLAQKGESDKALKILKRIAETNGRSKNLEELIQGLDTKLVAKNEVPSTGVVESLRILFRSGIGDRCLALLFSWFVAALTYYSITYFSKGFSEDRYLNVLFAGLVEIPAYFCGFYMVKIIGRPRSMFTLMMLCGLTSIALPFVPQELSRVKTVLSIIGKSSVSAVFFVSYLMASEVVPTLQRSSNMSLCSAFARVGSFTAPFLMYMRKIHPSIPNLVMGALAISSGLISIFRLPETKGVTMPDSAEEARNNKRIYGLNLFKKFSSANHKLNGTKEEREGIL